MDSDLELLRELVSALPDPVFVITESGHCAAVLGGRDSGYYHDVTHLAGLRLHDMLEPDQADWFMAQVRRTLEDNNMRAVEYRLSGADVDGIDDEDGPHGKIHFEGHVQPMDRPVQGERAVVWLARNVNRRRQREDHLRQLSETDPLTGVFNRRKLYEQLDQAFSEFLQCGGSGCALILFDIDRFKSVNDQFGHGVGDQVLCRVAELCTSMLRDSDSLFRVGGEEFAVLVPGADLSAAAGIAHRLRAAIARETAEELPDSVAVTISVGVSAFQPADGHAEAMVQRADTALYAAKDAGRNRVVVEWD
jgi:diguanylate cyclase (GGDEF)-like protein